MTKRSRGIWHAWYFYYALSLMFKVHAETTVLCACTP
ncbi:DUF3265 domain-containing protein [Vibrio parahaemolyticus]|nr:DUF3265 domain-containing protein [Vibrio parahaemolyticus]